MSKTLSDKLMGVLETQLGIAIPSADTDLFESGVLDSLSFVNLLMYIESEFGVLISFDTFDSENLSTVDQISDYISRTTEERVVYLAGGTS